MYRETLTSTPFDFYTPLEEAVEELRRRRRNSSLQKRVEDCIGSVPAFLSDTPKGILARFIATPNYEMTRFLTLTKGMDIEPVLMELTMDKFCTRNPDKLSLIHMPLYVGKDRHGKTLFEYHNIADCTKSQGKCFSNITTYEDEPLVSLHHRLISSLLQDVDTPVIIDDASYLMVDGQPKLFYSYFLPRFIYHGILFENFTEDKEEQIFFANVVLPNFIAVTRYFGVKPLIVPLLPEPLDIFWRCYPYELKKDICEGSHNKCELASAS